MPANLRACLLPGEGFEEKVVLASQAEDSKDAKEIAAILAEENVELVPEEERDRLQELDSLTGQPSPTDSLLYALPVSVCSHFSRFS